MKSKESILLSLLTLKKETQLPVLHLQDQLKETKLFLPHGSGLKYNSLFTKLKIAKRITAGYFMKFKALFVQSYL